MRRLWAEGHRFGAQPMQKFQPVSRVGNKHLFSVEGIFLSAMLIRANNPAFGRCQNCTPADFTLRLQIQIADDRQKIVGSNTQPTNRGSLYCTMLEILRSLLREWRSTMPIDRAWVLKYLIEHSWISF